MLIAAKLEEEHFPSIEEMNLAVSCATHRSEEFNDFAQARFTKKDYVRMEARICNVLKFKLQGINMYHFMDRFLQASTAGDGHYWPSFPNETLDSLVSYYLDLALMEYDFSRSFRSQIVASAIFLARLVLGLRARNGKLWSESLQYYTGYCMSELGECSCVFAWQRLFLAYKSDIISHHHAANHFDECVTIVPLLQRTALSNFVICNPSHLKNSPAYSRNIAIPHTGRSHSRLLRLGKTCSMFLNRTQVNDTTTQQLLES